MSSTEQESTPELERRIKNLEEDLSRLRRQLPSVRSGWRQPALLGVLLVGAFATWAVGAGENEVKEELFHRASDGAIETTGPVRILGSGGEVLLSVSTEDNAQAAVSISTSTGAGGIATRNPSGVLTAFIGQNSNGYGTVFTYDDKGTPRSYLQGNGNVFVHNESGKQVALLGSFGGTGTVGVWGASQKRVIAMTEAANGSGLLTILDKSQQETLTLSSTDSGGGLVNLFSKAKSVGSFQVGPSGAGELFLSDAQGVDTVSLQGSSADRQKGVLSLFNGSTTAAALTVNEIGAGDLVLNNASGGTGLEAEGAPVSHPGYGGLLLISNAAGETVASVGTLDETKGVVSIQQQGKALAVLLPDQTGAGSLKLNTADGKLGVEATGRSDGAAVTAYNADGELAANLGVSADGKGLLTAFDSDNIVAELRAVAGQGQLVLRDSSGKAGVQAFGGGTDGASLAILNSAEEPVAGISVSKLGLGAVSVFNSSNVVAELTGDTEGAGYFYLADTQGNITLDANAVDAASKGGSITAFNNNQVVATLGSAESGVGQIAVYSAGKPIAEMTQGASGSGGGLIRVRNSKDVVVAGMTGGNDDAGRIAVMDSSGATTADMLSTGDGRGQLAIWDKGGASKWAVITKDAEGGGVVQVFNQQTNVGTLMASGRGGGYLQLVNAAGTTVVEAGASDNGVGVVRAGPAFKCSGPGGMGLVVPDCIVGRLQ